MSPPEEATPASRQAGGEGGSLRVALGILASRITGLAREAAIAGFLGLGPHADVLAAVFRGPNLLQNLLGEQTLSASFIPVYSRFLARGRAEAAGRFAGAVCGLLLVVGAVFALLGVVLAPQFVTLFAPGFLGDAARVAAGEAEVDRFALAVRAVRWTLPMAAVLMMSAWSLGVLNSHRRFFLSYVAPVVWNATIIAGVAAVFFGLAHGGAARAGTPLSDRLLLGACVGAFLGAVLQVAVQLPRVAGLLRGFRLSLSTRVEGVRTALTALSPVLAARGAMQLSTYLDQVLASVLAAGALSSLRWASLLYLLPVALFALSVAAAELPEMARRGPEEPQAVARRARAALRQIGFLVIPTTVGYLLLGFLIVGALYRWQAFSALDNWLVFLVLAAYTLGLPAAAASRLLVNAFYALGETAAAARIAVVRLALAPAVGVPAMLLLDGIPVSRVAGAVEVGSPLFLGATGLALGSAIASWVELVLLRRALGRRLPGFALPLAAAGGMALRAVVAAAPVAALLVGSGEVPLRLRAALLVVGYAALYFALSRRSARQEIEAWLGRLGRRRGR
ncbi:MAG: lipid II flippase MurJ [Thermoanaerobaculia bacterium]|nr:lipid II flippase MurJ [Thermoanaerobaculia bacterium]